MDSVTDLRNEHSNVRRPTPGSTIGNLNGESVTDMPKRYAQRRDRTAAQVGSASAYFRRSSSSVSRKSTCPLLIS